MSPGGLASVTRLSEVLSAAYLEHACALPIERQAGRVRIATWRESIDVQALDDLRMLFDADLELEHHDEHEVRAAIKRVYASDSTAQGLDGRAFPRPRPRS